MNSPDFASVWHAVLSDLRHDGADSKAHLAAIRDALNRRQ